MALSQQLARQIRGLHFGPNWTDRNLRDMLTDITWQEATTQVYSLNTILALVYHINYYIHVTIPVLQGKPLDAHDKFSFDHPPVASQEEWEDVLNNCWRDAEEFADLVDAMPEEQLWETMADEKYGSFYNNIHGTIEHSYYHMGQIALIRKILRESAYTKA